MSARARPRLHSAFCIHHSAFPQARCWDRTSDSSLRGTRDADFTKRARFLSPRKHGDTEGGWKMEDRGSRDECCAILYLLSSILSSLSPSVSPCLRGDPFLCGQQKTPEPSGLRGLRFCQRRPTRHPVDTPRSLRRARRSPHDRRVVREAVERRDVRVIMAVSVSLSLSLLQ